MYKTLIRNVITCYLHLEHNLFVDLGVRNPLTGGNYASVLPNRKSLPPTDAIKCQNSAMRKHIDQAPHRMVCHIGDRWQPHRLCWRINNHTDCQWIIHHILNLVHIYRLSPSK